MTHENQPVAGQDGYPPAPSGATGYPPAPAGQAAYPPVPAGQAAYPPVPAGQAAYPPVPAGQVAYPPPPAGQAAYPPAPAAPRQLVNPFHDVPVRDYVTDGAALLLLCVSLGLGWDATSRAAGHVEVLLATLVSVLSLGVGYLGRAGAFQGQKVDVPLVRALVNVPYAVVVVVYAVLTIVDGFDTDVWGGLGGGLGGGLALGLAGAALAATPRSADLATMPPARARTFATVLLGGLLALAGILQVGSLLAVLFRASALGVSGLGWVYVLLDVVLLTGCVAWPVVGVLRGDAGWRPVLVGAGAAAATWFLLADAVDGVPSAALHAVVSLGATGLVALPAAGAVATTAVVAGLLRADASPLDGWFRGALHGLLYLAAASAGLAVVTLFEVLWIGDYLSGRGQLIAFVVLGALVAVGALVARALFRADPVGARPAALAVTGLAVVVGIAQTVLAAHAGTVPAVVLVLAFGVPGAILWSLLVPTPVRAFYASAAPRPVAVGAPQGAYPGPTPRPYAPQQPQPQPQPQQPPQSQPVPVPVQAAQVPDPAAQVPDPAAQVPDPAAQVPARPEPPAHGFTAAQAVDARTPAHVLAAIAERAPELRAYVAANPSTYPALLEWLSRLDDPTVRAALAARPQR